MTHTAEREVGTLHLTPEQSEALEIARELARAGIPVFVAPADNTKKIGFALPEGWQQTEPDPAAVGAWRPGMALCAVMGCGLDLIDIDPRNGGDPATMNGHTPRCYGVQLTPSGGIHTFVHSLGTGSRDNVWPGIDVKSGMPDGSGRGFAFIAPTVKISKTTGAPAAYRWAQRPDVARLIAVCGGADSDTSGDNLAARIRELKADSGVRKAAGPGWYREFLLSDEPQSQPAAERAIADKLAEVAGWRPESGAGFRQTLMRAAMTLGGYVGGGYLAENDARHKLTTAVAEVWGTPDEDDERWIAQGLTDGSGAPFYVFTAADELAYSEIAQATGRAPTGGAGEPPWTAYTAIGTEPFDPTGDNTDQGLAEAVAARMYPALRYAADAGTWLVRDRHVWREREDMGPWALSTVARLMPLGETPVPKAASDRTEAHWQAARRARFMDSSGAGKIERKLRSIVRNTDHPGAVELAALDADPEILWAGGIPWDLRASADGPVAADMDPATPHLRTALYAPDLSVPTPRWDAYLDVVLPDPEVRAWALRVLSIAFTGIADAALPILHGPERSGKTSLVQMLVEVLGSYGHAADARLLSGADTHASVVYALMGRRLSFIDEGPRRGHLAVERLKQLTGGGALTGNAMRANPVTFRPTHTLVMTCNPEPDLTDPALRARVRLIPCNATETAVRPARLALLGDGLRTEAPGILARLMREAARYLADPDSAGNRRAPAGLQAAVEEMAAGQDPVREWQENCTVPADPGTQARALYERFATWYEGQARFRRIPLPSMTAWGRSLSDLGFPAVRDQGPRGKHVYRPLSVLNGPGTPAPWEPTQKTRETRETPPQTALPIVVPTVADSSEPQLSAEQNPSSTPVSSSLADSADSSYRSIDHNTNTSPIRSTPVDINTGKPGTNCRQSANAEKNPGSPAKTGLPTVSVSTVGASALGNSRVTSTEDHQSPLSATQRDIPELRRGAAAHARAGARHQAAAEETDARAKAHSVTRQVAQLAAAEGITKTEARARLKAAARAEQIQTAQGEVLLLPAVVDRDGNTLPVTEEQAAAVVRAAIGRSGALTVDVETSGYPIGHRHYRLRSVQLGDDTAAVVLHPVDHAETVRTLLAEAPRLHAHSATADLAPLDHAGLIDAEDAWARMHDTVIPAKLADPASTGSDPGLKQLAGTVLGEKSVAPAAEAGREALFESVNWLTKVKTDTPVERSGWAQVATGSAVMLRYAASDVLDTAALAKALSAPSPAVMDRERTAQRMTARVAHRGLRVDGDHVGQLLDEHTTARAEGAAKVRSLGVDNPGSGPQVAAVLTRLGATLPISEKGNPSVAEAVLVPLRETPGPIGELATAVLIYRHHDKAVNTYLEPYHHLTRYGDGRARPTVYTLGADTGRMSCVRPNLQQVPRTGGFRACITADPGQVLISADFSSVEIRAMAALSQDPQLMQQLAQGVDLHSVIAEQVFGPEWTKADRYTAKRGVFGWAYGGGITTLARQVGTSETVMASVVDVLRSLAPQFVRWAEQVKHAVRTGHTQFPAYSGRIIHLPRAYPHKVVNYCLAADTPILRSDLTHVPASRVQVGDRLVAFDEFPTDRKGGVNRYHHMRTAVVEATSLVQKPSVTVHTADGKATTCSADHLWLVRPKIQPGKGVPRTRWVKAADLRPGDFLLSLGTWRTDTSRSAGYLAGLYDGEGSLKRHRGGRRQNQLFFSQNRGAVMNGFCEAMDELGLPYSYHSRSPNSTSTTDTVVVSGLRNVLRVLGTLRPERFRSRFEDAYEGNAITAGLTQSVAVVAVEDAGELGLVSIQTSTRTLVANGYLSHNCVQGTARELLIDALIRWQDTRWGTCTLLPVHDEIVVAVPGEDADEATAALVAAMETDLFGVRIAAEASEPSFAWTDAT